MSHVIACLRLKVRVQMDQFRNQKLYPAVRRLNHRRLSAEPHDVSDVPSPASASAAHQLVIALDKGLIKTQPAACG